MLMVVQKRGEARYVVAVMQEVEKSTSQKVVKLRSDYAISITEVYRLIVRCVM